MEFEAKLGKYGLSEAGKQWVSKALHPAFSKYAGVGVPDSCIQPTARPEYIREAVFGPPGDVEATAWDMLVLMPPSNTIAAYVIRGPAGTDFTVPWVTSGVTVSVVYWDALEQVQYQVYQYWVARYGTDLPGLEIMEGQTMASAHARSSPVAWRQTYRSCTAYLTASALSNGGTVTAGNYPAFGRVSPMLSMLGDVDLGPPGTVIQTSYAAAATDITVPLTESAMSVSNPKVFVGPAREGLYLPVSLEGPDVPWARPAIGYAMLHRNAVGQGTGVVWGTSDRATEGFRGNFIRWIANTSTFGVVGYGLHDPSGLPLTGAISDGFDGGMVGVQLWRNLAAGPQGASVTFKFIVGHEVAVTPDSPIVTFVKPAPEMDLRALEAYFAIVQSMPQGYPASANSWGSILTMAGRALSTLFPGVASAVSSVARSVADGLGPPRAVGHATQPGPPRESGRAVTRVDGPRRREPSVSSRVSRASVGSRTRKTKRASFGKPKSAMRRG